MKTDRQGKRRTALVEAVLAFFKTSFTLLQDLGSRPILLFEKDIKNLKRQKEMGKNSPWGWRQIAI